MQLWNDSIVLTMSFSIFSLTIAVRLSQVQTNMFLSISCPSLRQFVQLMSIGRRVLGEKLFCRLMKATVYGQFIAGENRDAIKPVLERYRDAGVKSILDYAVEEDVSDEGVMAPVR